MYSITLNEAEKTNLLIFLKRTDLRGSEAQVFVSLIEKISTAPKIDTE